jgi:hypothetical protein
VRLTAPRRGGWRAWGAVRADFERALADPADPAIATAEVASELRRGADYVRVTLAITVLSTDGADALRIAWDAFRSAARDDLAGWEVTAAPWRGDQPQPCGVMPAKLHGNDDGEPVTAPVGQDPVREHGEPPGDPGPRVDASGRVAGQVITGVLN